MSEEKELQEKMVMYRTLESRLEAFAKERDIVNSKIEEILLTLSTMDEIKNGSEEILFKLGNEGYVKGKIEDSEKMLVYVGAGVVMEKTFDEGKNILLKRKETLDSALKEIDESIGKISAVINRLAPEINELIKKSQKPISG